ncbi:MAG: hypothetical protein LC793_16810 [Thermomicrobia bacterium]|nr:hypothetical protein [Thermomicrobia bacterium]
MLQGTEYLPNLEGAVLFLEDDDAASPQVFDRELQSLLLHPRFSGVRGMVFGRFQRRSRMTPGLLARIVGSKRELDGIPVVADVDFGHTDPKITFALGGTATVEARHG